MRFNFRKIASVLASAVMIGSTLGIAAAANYPTPFVSSAGGDVAVIVGSGAATGDFIAAADLGNNLQAELAKLTATGGTSSAGTVTGEAAALFTSSSKLYMNDTLNAVKTVATKTDLPVALKDGSFSGDVDATYTQTVDVGSNPQLTFAKQPTSSDDPSYGLTLSTSSGQVIYNATITFNKQVNFTHADSKNQELTLFGQKYTVGSATTGTNLVLLKEATKLNFDSSGTTSQEVTISEKKYTVELVSASTTAATIKVTNDAGASEQKEVSEGYSKKINGITVAINTADSNNLKYTASVVAGAEKVTLTSGSAVTYGESDTVMDGTEVTFTTNPAMMTKIVVGVRAPSSDKDSILPGGTFVDPVFGSFKVDFSSLNIADNSTSSAREDIKVRNSGDDKMTVEMADSLGNSKTVQWAINTTSQILLQHDSDSHNILISERVAVNKTDMVMVGNEDEGHLVKISQLINQTTGYSQDKITFVDVFSGESYTSTLTAEGAGTVTIGGKVYAVTYFGSQALTDDAKTVRLNYPDSSGTDSMIIYPTIKTSKGAKVAFYKPLVIALDNWDGDGTDLATIRVPNGAKAYQDIAVILGGAADGSNMTIGGTLINLTGSAGAKNVSVTNTGFNWEFKATAANQTTVYLVAPDSGAILTDPALMIFEEKDDNNRYEGLIVTLEAGRTGDDGIGISDVIRTWGSDAIWDAVTLASNSKQSKDADLWGTVATIDSGDSDQQTATISYPDEQVNANIYVAKNDATITGGTVSGGTVKELGSVTVKDTEVTQVSSKNLIVVGGSCINEVARKIVDSTATAPVCGATFTEKVGVGADQALIKVVKNPYLAADTTKIAMLVAGYEAADTTKAVKYVTTSKPSSAVGDIKLSTSAAVATVATTGTTA